jgi:galactose mutarotase-like enzyme
MEYIIKNQYLTATIDSKGAELRTLVDQNQINRMHIPSVDTWNRVSPILFPQVSKTRDLLYTVEGKEYHMPMHGFFRDLQLTPIIYKEDELVFEIKETEETLKIYPYCFEFKVTYKLIDNALKVTFKVSNKGKKEMLYMLGGHPGFKVPLYENEQYSDYYLKFEEKETVDAMQVVDGYLANEFKRALTNEDVIVLKHEMYNPDAIVLKDLKSSYVDLMSYKNDKVLRFHFKDFSILAVWSLMKENANFVCLEPWNGIQKKFVKEHEKMGVLSLKENEEKEFSYTIEIIK